MCIVSDVNFIANNKNEEIKTVKFRYRSKDVIVINYEWINNETIKIFYDTHLAVTPGQACVFYQNDYCLGGGEIKTVFLDKEERAYENWDNN
jgi:tRNA-specific 2-thiouridylase